EPGGRGVTLRKRLAHQVPGPEPAMSQASTAAAIVFDEARKVFPGAARPAVEGASFAVAPGHLVVLLGPSGCGKTTLLKMVNRLYELSGGHILVDDVDVQALPVSQLRRRIGYVIQN